jgi:hypothetical protein
MSSIKAFERKKNKEIKKKNFFFNLTGIKKLIKLLNSPATRQKLDALNPQVHGLPM